MSTIAGVSLILVATVGAPAEPPIPHHVAEIKIFASTVAIARTASEECIGTAINEAYLDDLRQRLHVVEADYPAYVPEARAVVDVLHQGLSEAPSRQKWCDAVLRMYGPTGYVIPGLLQNK